jgi:transcription elongation GreA/GreB family factor
MSRAFVKDQEDSDSNESLPARPISPNPNYVTARGLRLMDEEISALRHAQAEAQRSKDRAAIARVSRDLRYWVERRTTAQLIEPPAQPTQVAFASRVTIEREDGRKMTLAIVGEDEGDPKQGLIAYSTPLARALLGCSVGDTAATPTGEVEILAIEPVGAEGA